MARIQTGPLVSSISGRIGGLVLRQTRFGCVVQTAAKSQTYTTPPAVRSKAVFAAAIRAWAIMPQPLKTALVQLQKDARLGTPGPWVKNWITYDKTGEWRFRPVTHPQVQLKITTIVDNPPWWDVYFTTNAVFPNDRFWLLLFHPTGTFYYPYSWIRPISTGSPTQFAKQAMPPGSSLMLVPTTVLADDVFTSGDAHPLP